MGFSKKAKYYTGTVYEWNLPVGHTCPYADECLVKVGRETGKMDNRSKAYRCYAASAERFPGVRKSRWNNLELSKRGELPALPKAATAVRIHSSGDFFNQAYFDLWLDYARENSGVDFWAYTKSLSYWVKRLDQIPANFVLTASKGGRQEHLINEYGLRSAEVVWGPDEASGPIDTNDDLARTPGPSFFLLDNNNRGNSVGKRFK